ncbi:MAG TPA: glycosyltransferase [Pyrinomonadaceae bacterium]|jgi:glycosyltransferase involved in cell wall biosynthesis
MEQTNQSKPKVLIICFTNLHSDPRVLRQISWLKDKYDITTLGLAPSRIEGVAHVQYDEGPASPPIGKLIRAIKYFTGDYESFYWNQNRTGFAERMAQENFDWVIANDVETLPLAVGIKAKSAARVMLDAHEYSPLEMTESLKWRVFRQPLYNHICVNYITRADIATTVCQTIAETYQQNFHKKFEIITNATDFVDLQPSETKQNKIRLIYHGGVSIGRQTDKQIEMMRYLDERFELNLMLVGEESYIESLKKLAAPFKNIRFLPPVKTNEIANFINQFDVGIYSLAPTNFNNKYALPNKLFEFIQGRLAICVAPSPEMARIVKEFDLGVVAQDFSAESMAQAIKTLTTEKIAHFKAQSAEHAYELSAERNRERFLGLIESAN